MCQGACRQGDSVQEGPSRSRGFRIVCIYPTLNVCIYPTLNVCIYPTLNVCIYPTLNVSIYPTFAPPPC